MQEACVHHVWAVPKALPERDDFSSIRHPAFAYWWSMIFSENPSPTLPCAGGHQGLPRGARNKCGQAVTGRGWLTRLLSTIELALEVRRERRMLRGLDERALKDLGLKGEADAEASRPFWDVPIERLGC
jgi:uncharacterized protein YjiS (DUF1127 family)